MKSQIAALLFVAGCANLAVARDTAILSGRDDAEFARALAVQGFPDLAERLLQAMEAHFAPAGSHPSIEVLRRDMERDAADRLAVLDRRQEEALKVTEPVPRVDALLGVLREKQAFIEACRSSPAAEECTVMLPDLYGWLAQPIATTIARAQDQKSIETLRAEGDALFSQAEASARTRIAELKAIAHPGEADRDKLMAASYNVARLFYFHALLYPAASKERIELCNWALIHYDEFDRDYEGELLNVYGAVDAGLCLKEIGKGDEAIDSFDRAIAVRESWGDKVDGKWPVESRDIVDLVAYATFQKMSVLREQKKPDLAVAAGRDYFASTPDPWNTPSCMELARNLAEALLAKGDAKGCAAIADQMIQADPQGYGGSVGRDLKSRAGGGKPDSK